MQGPARGAGAGERGSAMEFLTPILAGDNEMLWGIGGAIAITAILAGSVTSIVKTRARERSRREIAAYIAEGSMSAEEGERLMKASGGGDED